MFIIDKKSNRLYFVLNNKKFQIKYISQNNQGYFNIDCDDKKINIQKVGEETKIYITIKEKYKIFSIILSLMVMFDQKFNYYYLNSYNIEKKIKELALIEDKKKILLNCMDGYIDNLKYIDGFTLGDINDNDKILIFINKNQDFIIIINITQCKSINIF